MPNTRIVSLLPVLLLGLACACSSGQSYDPTRTWLSGAGFFCLRYSTGGSRCWRQQWECRDGERVQRLTNTPYEPCTPVPRAACFRYETREGNVWTRCRLTLEECELDKTDIEPPYFRIFHDCQFVE